MLEFNSSETCDLLTSQLCSCVSTAVVAATTSGVELTRDCVQQDLCFSIEPHFTYEGVDCRAGYGSLHNH
jgi:hypothetical protein